MDGRSAGSVRNPGRSGDGSTGFVSELAAIACLPHHLRIDPAIIGRRALGLSVADLVGMFETMFYVGARPVRCRVVHLVFLLGQPIREARGCACS
jgi:hypothetical protein